MTEAKKKAEELVEKFKPYMDGWRKTQSIHFAKQCAIICVNEIISAIEKPTMISYEEWEEHHDYWTQVLTELNKM